MLVGVVKFVTQYLIAAATYQMLVDILVELMLAAEAIGNVNRVQPLMVEPPLSQYLSRLTRWDLVLVTYVGHLRITSNML